MKNIYDENQTLIENEALSQNIMLNNHNDKILEGSSKNKSSKKSKVKTVKKYKISFSYICTSDQDSSEISPKILNFQRLDQVSSSSDHKFVSHKLKPVMTCIVQRLIQEYRRSKDPKRIQKYRSKSSANETYSLSSTSYEQLAKVKMKKALEKGRKEDIITSSNLMKQEKYLYTNSDERSDENVRTLKSHSTTKLKKAGKVKQTSSISSKPLMTCNSSSHSGSPVFTRRSVSTVPNSETRQSSIHCFAKDTFLFKRTKTSNYINIDIPALLAKCKILKSENLNGTTIFVNKVVEVYSAIIQFSKNVLVDYLCLSELISYRRNIHLPEYSVIEKNDLEILTDNICINLICLEADTEVFERYYMPNIQDINFSNEEDVKKNEDEKQRPSPSKSIHIQDDNLNDSTLKNENVEKKGETSCMLLKKLSKKNSHLKLSKNSLGVSVENDDDDDDDLTSSTKFSVIPECEICHGDPVICLEAEGRKSLMELYANLLEEAQGVTIERKSDNTIDIEHLKKLLYEFMDENNMYPSERVKTDILRRKSIAASNYDDLISHTTMTGLNEIVDEIHDDNVKFKESTKIIQTENQPIYVNLEDANMKEEETGENKSIIKEKKGTKERISEVRKVANSEELATHMDVNDNGLTSTRETKVANSVAGNVYQKMEKLMSKNPYLPEIIVDGLNIENENEILSPLVDVDKLKVSLISNKKELNFDNKGRKSSNLKLVPMEKTSEKGKFAPKLSVSFKSNKNDKNMDILKVSPISQNPSFEEIIEKGVLHEYLENEMAKKKDSVIKNEYDDDDEYISSIKVFEKPKGRRSTILRRSVFHNLENIPKPSSDAVEKLNQSVEVDPYPSNDIFVEIEDQQDRRTRRFSVNDPKVPFLSRASRSKELIETVGDTTNFIYDSNTTPPPVSSSSSVIQISTFANELKVEQESTESSSESPGSQDTSEDIIGKYPNEITNLVDISNEISLENEEKIIHSLKKSLINNSPLPTEKFISQKQAKESMKSHVKSISPEEQIINERKTMKSTKSVNKDYISEKNASTNTYGEKATIATQTGNDENYFETPSNLSKRNRLSSIMFREMDSQTGLQNLNNLNKSCQTNPWDFDGERENSTMSKGTNRHTNRDKSFIEINEKALSPKTVGEEYDLSKRDKNLEIDDLLNKLKLILAKSEEYLEKLSEVSKKPQNFEMQGSVNISQDIFNLLKNICKKEESVHLSDEERYRILNNNLETICKSLNSTEPLLSKNDENIDKHSFKGKLNDSILRGNFADSLYERQRQDDNHVEFADLDNEENDSLLDQVVRCVMYKLIESQARSCISQGTSTDLKDTRYNQGNNIPKKQLYHGDINLSKSLDNFSSVRKQIPVRCNDNMDDVSEYTYTEKSSKRASHPNIDSFIGECLPKESTDMINVVRNNQEKIDRINIYDEIACRMENLLQQVKKSQREVASRRSIRSPKTMAPFSNINPRDRTSIKVSGISKWPRSYSTSDIEGNGKCTTKDVTRHTVASIQNISPSLNQSVKIKGGFRNIRKDLKDRATRIMINSRTRPNMLCSSVEDNFSNSANRIRVLKKTICRKKIFR